MNTRNTQAIALLLPVLAGTGIYGCRHPATSAESETSLPVRLKSWTFADGAEGKVPAGWKSVSGNWQIANEPTAPSPPKVLAQVAKEHRGSHFSLTLAEQAALRDATITLKYRAVAGDEDQGGGPVWRYQDKENYYVARENPLEGNYRVYKVLKGRRIQLGSADVKAPAGQWHSMRISMIGNHIECSLNGRKYLDVKDDTFAAAGPVGLWTKADAQTQFDEVQVEGR